MTIIKDWYGNVLDNSGYFRPWHSTLPRNFSNWDSAEDYLCELLDDYYDEERGEYYIETTKLEDILND